MQFNLNAFRYRGYCSRRLARIRKAVKFVQGDKKKFTKKEVTLEVIKDPKFLLIPLMTAERAWAYAMQVIKKTRGGFLKHYSRAILELISSYSPTFQNEFLKKSWRFQNPELENNSGITQDCNIFSTSYSPTFSD